MSITASIDKLFASKDGGKAFGEAEKVLRAAAKRSAEAREGAIRYMLEGRFGHVREHIAATLAERAKSGDEQLAAAFRRGLKDEETCYWSIAGVLKTAGRDAYNEVAKLALNSKFATELRAQAIKCLAVHSGQPFDRGLDEDPGSWSEKNLRTKEVRTWMQSGFAEGTGYALPDRHPALDNPQTQFEKTVAKLEKRLAKLRAQTQDPANPSNWLTPAQPADLKAIQKKWKLPAVYLDFLTRFSPLHVQLADGDDSAESLHLFGASDLLAGQQGYSIHGRTGKTLKDWPADYVVIGQRSGDPYVLDLSASDGNEAPVLTAVHGQGTWEFTREAASFQKFLAALARGR